MPGRCARVLLLVVALALFGYGVCDAARPRVVLLLTLDTTRADHLSFYGYARPTAPEMGTFASGGVLVRRAITTMPTTDPAHASMLTGLHPRHHGIRMNGQRMADDGVPTLASWARRLGYRTAAFVSRAHLRPEELGLAGFEHSEGPTDTQVQIVGGRTLDAATTWIRAHASELLFVWVHLFDPHTPYGAPPPFTHHFCEAGDRAPPMRGNGASRDAYAPSEVRVLTALYDGEIAYVDELAGRLFKMVREVLPAGEAPLVIVAGDHGEALGELDERLRYAFDHGALLYQGIIEVPLVLRWDGVLPAGRTIEGPASLVDVAPTLFELMGDAGFPTEGVSLLGQIRGEDGPKRQLVFTERRLLPFAKRLRYRALEQFSVQDGRYKLILSTPFARTELYDLDRDPGERENLARALPDVEAELRGAIERWRQEVPTLASRDAVIPPEKVEALRALGYVE
jgi:arylsulfatase A-like enzyme